MVLQNVQGPSFVQVTANNSQGSLGNVRSPKKDAVSCWHLPDRKKDTLCPTVSFTLQTNAHHWRHLETSRT